MNRRHFLLRLSSLSAVSSISPLRSLWSAINFKEQDDEFWKQRLDKKAYEILREKATERAYSGKYWDHKEDGIYHCAGCDLELFDSKAKYDSKTGWPSFWDVISKANISLKEDRGFFMLRTEVLCRRCDGHQGHVFKDGPQPTGLRYCINSAALKFRARS